MDEEELLKKIQALEEGQAELRREVSAIQLRRAAAPQYQPSGPTSRRPPPHAGLSRGHHRMIMESLGQAVHVLDLRGKVLYWNRYAEHLYGYAASEAIDQDIKRLIVDDVDVLALNNIIGKIFTGKCWRGKFPVKNKSGERFSVVVDATPLYDDDGRLMGLICLADDTRTLEEIIGPSTSEYCDIDN